MEVPKDMWGLLYMHRHADLSNYDVATLSDWADRMKNGMQDFSGNRSDKDKGYQRAFSLIREGCDLLLRSRAKHEANGVCPHCTSPMRCYSNLVPNWIPIGSFTEIWLPYQWEVSNKVHNDSFCRCTHKFHICESGAQEPTEHTHTVYPVPDNAFGEAKYCVICHPEQAVTFIT